MVKNDYMQLVSDEPQDDPSLAELRETLEDTDQLTRQYPARETQLLPNVRYSLRHSKTGEHPPIRSTSTDSEHLLILPNGVESPLQDTQGESGAPYYGHDDEESVSSAV